ncbi:Imm7 family immunity protein [Deinococcus planocerae]|uniref:Imm7 family immunity protein n=1 Tax=Deinococcus planocerae TaxID=1737569 RepID=UPI0015E0FF1F|nr:Imm7 family immunity protein [Deinococcus planocerae]
MFEFHGWFALRNSTSEEDDQAMWGIVVRLRERIRRLGWESSASAEVRPMNGTYFLFVHGNLNRRGFYGPELDDLLASVAAEAPGSYGVMYWRDSERGDDNFTVRVMARGRLVDHPDPFLSPVVPTVEDAWEPGME